MIFGLNGKMGAGKNEAAKRLALLSPLPVVEVSYARKLKESVAALFGITLEQIEEWKNSPYHSVQAGDVIALFDGTGEGDVSLSFREFLQRYGTEAHRDVFGQDFWLDAALPRPGCMCEVEDEGRRELRPCPISLCELEHAHYDDALYVVTDMRFPNEAERVKDLGGWTVKIVGPERDTGNHPSEQELECDWVILNTVRDDDFAYLDSQLETLLQAAGVVAD